MSRRKNMIWDEAMEFAAEHNLATCRDGDCGLNDCFWCGDKAEEILEKIAKDEDRESH